MAYLKQRIKNHIRTRFGRTAPGRFLLQFFPRPPIQTLRFVSATRLSEKAFADGCLLGRSLSLWTRDPSVSVYVAYENSDGLSTVFNRALNELPPADATVFLHDDVALIDPRLLDKLRIALKRFDVVGVAGCRKRKAGQATWWALVSKPDADGERQWAWNWPNLSGIVQMETNGQMGEHVFGPAPADCEMLDGLFLATRTQSLQASGVQFDEQFRFHCYDVDFCRTAHRAGLSIGTWPIDLQHGSVGNFSSDAWQEAERVYFKKWGS